MRLKFGLLTALFIMLVSVNCRSAEQELMRQNFVDKELDRYEHKVLTFDASSITEKEKSFLRIMIEAAAVIEEINMLQINPNNLEYEERVQKEGSLNDKMLFHRNQCPWCLENDDPLCNALKTLPPKKIGWAFWPDQMTESMLTEMEKMPDASSLLSPFTYVKRIDEKRFAAVPFASYNLIAGRMEKLAMLLEKAVSYTDDPSLKKFLRSRADAFESGTAYPYDKSDYDWIAIKGPWEITIGPYETYKEPMKKKAQFEMYIGRENPDVSKKLSIYREHLQDFENHLADFIGTRLYKARKLDPRIVLRAVELIHAAGDGRSPHGATVAYHLPNRGKAVEEGLYKKVLLINHMELFMPLMQKRARVSLVPDQAPLVSGWADIMNTVFHEFAHGFGAHEELPIVTEGKKTTVAKALGASETLMEELKADAASLWFIPYLVKEGMMEASQVNEHYATAVMHMFGLLQYSLKGTYPQMAAIEIGNLMENGALTFDARTRLFTIKFDKVRDAIDSIMKKVVEIQLTGDKAGAEALRERYVKKLSGEKYEFSPLLSKPLASLKSAFDKAKLKSFAIDYEVSGLYQ